MGELFVLIGLVIDAVALSQAINGIMSWETLMIVGTILLVGGSVIRRMK